MLKPGDIRDIPSAPTEHTGIDGEGRYGNVLLQIRETIGRRESQEDQIFTLTTPIKSKDDATKLLLHAFEKADEKTHNNQEGSCATTAIVSKDNFITIAHLGDSPVVLFKVTADKKVTAHPLLRMHKPNDPEEKARIEKAGGFVEWGRVDGSLAISRAFGDKDYGDKVSKTPDITQINLADYIKPGEKAYLCVSCDGLYEGEIPENHFAQIIQQSLELGEKRIANKMKDWAYQHGSGDNISVILAELPETLTKSIAIGVCDGHGGSLTAKQASTALQEVLAVGKYPDKKAVEKVIAPPANHHNEQTELPPLVVAATAINTPVTRDHSWVTRTTETVELKDGWKCAKEGFYYLSACNMPDGVGLKSYTKQLHIAATLKQEGIRYREYELGDGNNTIEVNDPQSIQKLLLLITQKTPDLPPR